MVGVVAFTSLYVWYIPAIYHPVFWYVIPFAHSFQYLLFVASLKRGESAARVIGKTDAERRLLTAKYLGGFAVAVFGVALLYFRIVPDTLDSLVDYDHQAFGTQMVLVCFLVFVNIHHYFIDNVIWRRDNPAMKLIGAT
jgi:hypothetical protein